MKTILITGASDGLGLATAKMLCEQGQRVIIHGRSAQKLESASRAIEAETGTTPIASYLADLSDLGEVHALAGQIKAEHRSLDVLINNAGVYATPHRLASNGMDVRYVVNMIAPYMLTLELMPLLGQGSRVVNLSSAAQAAFDPIRFAQAGALDDSQAYAQSKLGVIMWTNALAAQYASKPGAPIFVSINPKSFLATPMVRTAYGVAGTDVRAGAQILCRAALSDEFAEANGLYFDNDIGRFAAPHPNARQLAPCESLVTTMNQILNHYLE